MIQFDQVPANVKMLATACFLQQVTHEQLTAFRPPDAIAFGEDAGLCPREYIAACRWLGEYFAAHAEALRAYVEARGDTP